MIPLIITVQPTGVETHYDQSVLLDERIWKIATYTNGVDGKWYFDIESDTGDVVRGLGLANGVELLFPYRHLDMPTGDLYLKDKGLGGADPSADDFAQGLVELYYLEAS